MIKSGPVKQITFKIFLLFIFAGAFFALFFVNQHGLISNLFKKTPVVSIAKRVELPVRIIIPKISTNALIQYVGLTSKGAMDVPSNSTDVAWFNLGPRPGELGSAVIAGHFDSKDGSAGVFDKLHTLKSGDKFYIEDNKGKSIAFVVKESRIYNQGDDVSNVFNSNAGAHLNLITCDGTWNNSQKSYSKRLVIFTDIIH